MAEVAGMVPRCDKTGTLFFSHKEVEVHREETGVQPFSQVSLDARRYVGVDLQSRIWKGKEVNPVPRLRACIFRQTVCFST